jgi:hypothetical protein
VLDGFAGDVWFFSIYLFMLIRMYDMPIPGSEHEWGWMAVVLVILCGLFFHSTQSTIADYYRNIHLHFLAGRNYTELVRSVDLTARRKAIVSWDRWFEWLWLFFYASYTRKQENWTPQLQRLLHAVGERSAKELPEQFLLEFRASSLPLMPMTNILTFNARAYTLFACLLLGVPILYFPIELFVFGFLRRKFKKQYLSYQAKGGLNCKYHFGFDKLSRLLEDLTEKLFVAVSHNSNS